MNSVLCKYSSGSTYELVCQNANYGPVQSVDTFHQCNTPFSQVYPEGLEFTKHTITGSVLSKTVCDWQNIVAISYDGGTSWQTCLFVSIIFSDDRWSGIYPYTLTLLVSPNRYGTSYSSSTVFGHVAVSIPAHVGNPICRLTYLGPSLYVPLQTGLAAVDGVQAVSFSRAAAETYNGVVFASQTPVYDNGLVIDTGNEVSVSLPVTALPATFAFRLSSHRYPSAWVTGLTGVNLLTANQSSIETDTTGLTTGGNGTLTRDTSAPLYGAASAKMVSAGSYDLVLKTATTAVTVTAGRWYAVQAMVRCSAAAGRQIKIGVAWYNASAALISTTYGTPVTCSSAIQTLEAFLQAPTGAVSAYLVITMVASVSGEYYYADCLQVEAIPATLGVLDNTSWNLTIDTVNGCLTWADDDGGVVDEIDLPFSVASFLSGQDAIVGVSMSATQAILACYQTAWTVLNTDVTMTLVPSTTLVLGKVSGNYLMGALSQLVEYPYALSSSELQALVLTSSPLCLGTEYIAYRSSGTITMTADGRLLDASGNDITGCLTGVVPVGVSTLSMTAGLTARWYVTVSDTWEV